MLDRIAAATHAQRPKGAIRMPHPFGMRSERGAGRRMRKNQPNVFTRQPHPQALRSPKRPLAQTSRRRRRDVKREIAPLRDAKMTLHYGLLRDSG
ncbi:hypothetical protein Aduo_016953 [Ancylostoma duodenale]